jgi:hypothetical protein
MTTSRAVRLRALLPTAVRVALMPADARAVAAATAHVFPPALVPVLRERFASSGGFAGRDQ